MAKEMVRIVGDSGDKTEIVSTRLDPELIKRLDQIAEDETRSRSQQIAHMLRQAVREYDKRKE